MHPKSPTYSAPDPGLWPYLILDKVCAQVDADASQARLIKLTNNAVFALPNSHLVVRIAGSAAVGRSAGKVVDVARWLEHHDMPTVRLATDVPQPLDIEGHAVSLWELVSDTGRSATARDIGHILRLFHSLNDAPDLPPWNTLGLIRSRLESADVLSSAEHGFLVETADSIAADLDEVDFVLAPGPIHGDPFVGNLIPGPDGPVLCDFDSTCVGPREWDLTPADVGRLRFRYPGDYHGQLVEAYGVDVLTWAGFPVFRRLRELKLVCSVLPVLATNPSVREQWRHRFDTFRSGDLEARWTTYR
ncbi:aminoglycoside phosphotransferase [Nocardioidaceae bacterium Broad-1]|nr:aminoglycoside phosphotransferase [Nocardioidaceae bacterium Broad-1]